MHCFDIVHLKKTQVVVDGEEETAVAVVIVEEGINSCIVGYLPSELIEDYCCVFDGCLSQVIKIFRFADGNGKSIYSKIVIESINLIVRIP